VSRLPLALLALAGCHAILPLGPLPEDGGGNSVIDGARPVDGAPRADAARPADAVILVDGGPRPGEAALLVDGATASGPWATSYGGAEADAIEALAVDSQGNVYVAGWTTGADQNIFVAKLAPTTGKELWSKTYGGSGNDRGLGIAVQGNNVYVTGAFEGAFAFGNDNLTSDGASDLLLARLDASTGNASWAKSWGSVGPEQGNGVAVDAQGTVYIVGDHELALDFGGGQKANPNGNGGPFLVALQNGTTPIWVREAGGNGVDHGYGVHANAGRVWFVGQVWGGSSLHDIYIASYTADAAGSVVFETTVASAGSDEARGVVVDPSGNAYVTGAFKGTMTLGGVTATATSTNYQVFVARLGLDGTADWIATPAAGYSDSVALGIAHAPGTVAITGSLNGPTSFGSTKLQTTNTVGDIFVATLDDATGVFTTAMGWGSTKVDEGHAVGIGGGAVYIAGEIGGGLTIGATPLAFLGGFSDGFVARVLP
jgi:hypothetical protein